MGEHWFIELYMVLRMSNTFFTTLDYGSVIQFRLEDLQSYYEIFLIRRTYSLNPIPASFGDISNESEGMRQLWCVF